MTSPPQTLARSLAARVAALPAVPDASQLTESVAAAVQRAAFEALDAGHTHYTDRPGILPLRERASALLGERFGVEIGASAITITCGAAEARFVAVKQLVAPAHFILALAAPQTIALPAALAGVPVTTHTDQAGIALIYATPAADPEQVRRAAERLPEAWIVFDLTQGGAGAFHPAQLYPDRTITIAETPAMSGWRVGWMAGSKAASTLRAYKQSMTICTPSISQWAALGADEP